MMGPWDETGVDPGHRAAFRHVALRLEQRVAEDLDPGAVWRAIRRAVRIRDPRLVDHVGWVSRQRRVWRVRIRHLYVYVVYDQIGDCPVTVLSPGQPVSLSKGKTWRRRILPHRSCNACEESAGADPHELESLV